MHEKTFVTYVATQCGSPKCWEIKTLAATVFASSVLKVLPLLKAFVKKTS